MEKIKRLFRLLALGCLVSWIVSVQGAIALEIMDAAGRQIVLDTLPQRIVVVGAAPFIPLHMLYMFDETRDRLKGFEVRVKSPDDFLKLLDPGLPLKQTLGTNPGPESVAALKPDLVISKATVEGAMARSLERLAIPVMYVGAETPEMFFKDIENLGQVLGNPERADRILDYFKAKLSLIHEKVGPVLPREKPGVLVLEYSNRGKAISLNVPAGSWIQTQQALISGGSPVWLESLNVRDGWQITGFEQIAAWNPDKIFLIVWYQLKAADVLKGLYQDSKWGRLTAVRQKNLFLFPQEIFGWDSASPRWILGTLWMAKMTYPERFSRDEMDMKQEVRQFFKVLYGLDDAVIDRHLMPEMD